MPSRGLLKPLDEPGTESGPSHGTSCEQGCRMSTTGLKQQGVLSRDNKKFFKMGKRVQLVKQYPEWDLQVRIERRGRGILLWHSAKEGLLYQLI